MHALAKNGGTLHIIYLFSKGNQHSPLLRMSQEVCLFVTGSVLGTVLHMATIKSHFPCNASRLSWELCFWTVLRLHVSQTSTPTDLGLNTRALVIHQSIPEWGIGVCFFAS